MEDKKMKYGLYRDGKLIKIYNSYIDAMVARGTSKIIQKFFYWEVRELQENN